jgi:hypothetical protein
MSRESMMPGCHVLPIQLAACIGHGIEAVEAVRNEKVIGTSSHVATMRKAVAAVSHLATRLVQAVSFIGSVAFRMGVDGAFTTTAAT